MSASLNLEPSPSSLVRALRFTDETLRGWGLDTLTDAACLVVATLLTDALEHARTAVTVDLQSSDAGVRVSVREGANRSRRRIKLRKRGTPARGLNLVTHYASDWGVEASEGGQVVWALITEEFHREYVSLLDVLRDFLDGIAPAPYDGFRVYRIDEPLAEPRSDGRAIVTAPDGSVAWLVWEANVRRYLRELRAPDDQRWGAWRVGLPLPLTSQDDGRAYFSAVIQELRPRWEDWHRERA